MVASHRTAHPRRESIAIELAEIHIYITLLAPDNRINLSEGLHAYVGAPLSSVGRMEVNGFFRRHSFRFPALSNSVEDFRHNGATVYSLELVNNQHYTLIGVTEFKHQRFSRDSPISFKGIFDHEFLTAGKVARPPDHGWSRKIQ